MMRYRVTSYSRRGIADVITVTHGQALNLTDYPGLSPSAQCKKSALKSKIQADGIEIPSTRGNQGTLLALLETSVSANTWPGDVSCPSSCLGAAVTESSVQRLRRISSSLSPAQ